MDIIVFPGESFFSKTERKRDKEENEYLNDYREIIFRCMGSWSRRIGRASEKLCRSLKKKNCRRRLIIMLISRNKAHCGVNDKKKKKKKTRVYPWAIPVYHDRFAKPHSVILVNYFIVGASG